MKTNVRKKLFKLFYFFNYIYYIMNIIKKRIIINCDINGTVIIKDSKYTKDTYISWMICVSSYGKIVNNEWIAVKFVDTYNIDIDSDLISYVDYLSKYHKDMKDEEKREICRNFVKKNGVGYKFKKYYNKAYKVYGILLPSFQNLLKLLQDNKYNDKYEFKIIFRTFGHDGLELIDEYFSNPKSYYYCKDFGQIRYLSNNNMALSYIRKNKNIKTVLENFYEEYIGFNNISDKINQILDTTNIMLIRDDYNGWLSCGKKGVCGKIIFNIKNSYQLFFDDYIQIKKNNDMNYDTKIININSEINSKTIYLQNINILNINSNYFIKLFNKIINDIKNKK